MGRQPTPQERQVIKAAQKKDPEKVLPTTKSEKDSTGGSGHRIEWD